MQMLLNLLVETEGIWSAILILSLFDGKFKNEFKVTTNLNLYVFFCRSLNMVTLWKVGPRPS
jgi:hypothetical protein